jgi:hypothetical protein
LFVIQEAADFFKWHTQLLSSQKEYLLFQNLQHAKATVPTLIHSHFSSEYSKISNKNS